MDKKEKKPKKEKTAKPKKEKTTKPKKDKTTKPKKETTTNPKLKKQKGGINLIQGIVGVVNSMTDLGSKVKYEMTQITQIGSQISSSGKMPANTSTI